jgi:hypothetical protein
MVSLYDLPEVIYGDIFKLCNSVIARTDDVKFNVTLLLIVPPHNLRGLPPPDSPAFGIESDHLRLLVSLCIVTVAELQR